MFDTNSDFLLDSDTDVNLMIDSTVDCKYITGNDCHDFFNFEDKTSINTLHLNARSLKSNMDKLECLLTNICGKLTAIAVTETWLTEAIADTYFIPGYNFISNNRATTGGDVGIFHCDSLNYSVRHDLCRMLPYIECLFIEIPQNG